MADIGPARNSDPDPSHDAGKGTDTVAGRAYSWQAVCDILDKKLPALALDLEGRPILTRKIIKRTFTGYLRSGDTKGTTQRRRVSDLMTQSAKGSPIVHFDLLRPKLDPATGKQLKFDKAGIVELTAKGWWWKTHPEEVDWQWPIKGPKGVWPDLQF